MFNGLNGGKYYSTKGYRQKSLLSDILMCYIKEKPYYFNLYSYCLDTISTYLSHESMLMHRYGYASQNGSYYDSLGSQVGYKNLKTSQT